MVVSKSLLFMRRSRGGPTPLNTAFDLRASLADPSPCDGLVTNHLASMTSHVLAESPLLKDWSTPHLSTKVISLMKVSPTV